MPTYLALGDSMSIDDYTGVVGGGAVHQFLLTLGCRLAEVPRTGRGDLITLTAGGNDLLIRADELIATGVGPFAVEHVTLLKDIRRANPEAIFIVGDIYAPAFPLSEAATRRLEEANEAIRMNCAQVGARLAPIHASFHGHEGSFLCRGIEPTLRGAREIANLFQAAYLGRGVGESPTGA
jgi:lysophospholipase L1-like esterase